jgi:methylthioribose-1-phosphate isomerase
MSSTYLIDNSVRLDGSRVLILDRRIFPFRREFVSCASYEEVAEAIEAMVTQSSGPHVAAGYGMVLAAGEADRVKDHERRVDLMQGAAQRLIRTRPTNDQIKKIVDHLLRVSFGALERGDPLRSLLEAEMIHHEQQFAESSKALGRAGASVLRSGDSILNHCWAETYIIETVSEALRQGKQITAYCTETRPYLQGARLTAECLTELGVETTVVTDGMGAHLMATGLVSKLLTGADRVTMDGHVINKVGTLQLAIAAREFGVPFFAMVQKPDVEAPTVSDVEIEVRDGDEVLTCMGVRTASHRAKGYYPAFDVTPPKFVEGVVTDRGIYSPRDLAAYYSGNSASASSPRERGAPR